VLSGCNLSFDTRDVVGSNWGVSTISFSNPFHMPQQQHIFKAGSNGKNRLSSIVKHIESGFLLFSANLS